MSLAVLETGIDLRLIPRLDRLEERRRAFQSFVVDRWSDVGAVMRERSTQTNEAAHRPHSCRCSPPRRTAGADRGGASAGLCLYPDRYAIRYDGRPALTASRVEIDVVTSGSVPIPARLPEIVDRVAIDLNPLDIATSSLRAFRRRRRCVVLEHLQ